MERWMQKLKETYIRMVTEGDGRWGGSQPDQPQYDGSGNYTGNRPSRKKPYYNPNIIPEPLDVLPAPDDGIPDRPDRPDPNDGLPWPRDVLPAPDDYLPPTPNDFQPYGLNPYDYYKKQDELLYDRLKKKRKDFSRSERRE